MEREAALALLALVLCGWLALAFGSLPPPRRLAPSGRDAEAAAWRRLWLPLLPAAVVFAVLAGWALQEPDPTDELVRPTMVFLVLPCALVWLRAGVRSVRSLIPAGFLGAATLGLLRPRAVISPDLAQVLDEDGLAAVREHEAAHVRHRDPLRIWAAQLAADLQWPWPSAARRFRAWRHALELARDEEARAYGMPGADLAAAILAASRLGARTMRGAAGLTGDAERLRDRISRLLAPLAGSAPSPRGCRSRAVAVGVLLAAGVLVGLAHGEALVRLLPVVSP